MKPYVVEEQIGDVTWYLVSGVFPTAYMAKQTFDRIERSRKTGTVGLYRHGTEADPGRIITGVSLSEVEARWLMHRLTIAEHNELDDDTKRGVILRRAKVVTEAVAAGQPYGRLKWRRPRGATLDPNTGDMIERPPGRG